MECHFKTLWWPPHDSFIELLHPHTLSRPCRSTHMLLNSKAAFYRFLSLVFVVFTLILSGIVKKKRKQSWFLSTVLTHLVELRVDQGWLKVKSTIGLLYVLLVLPANQSFSTTLQHSTKSSHGLTLAKQYFPSGG